MHRIRLAGPWELTPLEPAGPSRRVKLPASWVDIAEPAEERVRLRRSFHKPTGLDVGDRVALSIPFSVDNLFVDGNEVAFASAEEGVTCDLTPVLNQFHVVDLEVSGPAATDEPIWLTIHNSDDGD